MADIDRIKTKYKTYKKHWESQVSWINSVGSEEFSASCTSCVKLVSCKTFKIDDSGILLVNVHGKTKHHSEIEKQKKVKAFLPFQVM